MKQYLLYKENKGLIFLFFLTREIYCQAKMSQLNLQKRMRHDHCFLSLYAEMKKKKKKSKVLKKYHIYFKQTVLTCDSTCFKLYRDGQKITELKLINNVLLNKKKLSTENQLILTIGKRNQNLLLVFYLYEKKILF